MVFSTLTSQSARAFTEFLKATEKVETHADALRKKLLEYILDGLRKQHVKSISKETLLRIEGVLEDVVDNTLDSVVREVKHAEIERALNQKFVHIDEYEQDPVKKVNNRIQIMEYTPETEEIVFSDHYLPEEREATVWDLNKILNLKESHQ
jgi:hypothetical protein